MEKTRIIVEPFFRAEEIELGEWGEMVELIPIQTFYLNLDKDEKVCCLGSDNYLPGTAFGGIFFAEFVDQLKEIISSSEDDDQTPYWPEWPTVFVGQNITKDISETVKIVPSAEEAFPAFCDIWEYMLSKFKLNKVECRGFSLQLLNTLIEQYKLNIGSLSKLAKAGNPDKLILEFSDHLHVLTALRNFLVIQNLKEQI